MKPWSGSLERVTLNLRAHQTARFVATAVSSSAVHKGNAFEERALLTLRDDLSMSLRRVGGKSDGGVDLTGWWWLPALGAPSPMPRVRRIRLFCQCKAEKKKTSPHYVREMEGVMHRFSVTGIPSHLDDEDACSAEHRQNAPSSTSAGPPVAVFVSESMFSKSALLHVVSSPVPFVLLHLPPVENHTDADGPDEPPCPIGSVVFNPALSRLLGEDAEIRWEFDGTHATHNCGRPGMWWRGKKLQSWVPSR
ncbi:hypothetical protein FISHEDRAFT_55320 [Fistulina hepatica ATCC 64428]|uniref:Restriction endonuclease type IV Mrr domain-containing protein n=1 Tax=Fistulina hepatica ATCC 64428 TaxID=1128425 RepID=A0A0D7ANC5_9AGAR|nr:hypothetical protein FISHEDRAFT_55320 [Fistulina hepatica ATCC 64428]